MGFGVYIASTQVYGIPFWWVFRVIPLSGVTSPGTFDDSINPISPTQIGEHETVIVTDATTRQPIEGVNLTVYYGGETVFSTSTNSQGTASFSYAGSPTIIDLAKVGYTSRMEVLPNAPEQWVNGTYWSALWGGLGFVVSVVGLALQLKVIRHPAERTRRKRRGS